MIKWLVIIFFATVALSIFNLKFQGKKPTLPDLPNVSQIRNRVEGKIESIQLNKIQMVQYKDLQDLLTQLQAIPTGQYITIDPPISPPNESKVDETMTLEQLAPLLKENMIRDNIKKELRRLTLN